MYSIVEMGHAPFLLSNKKIKGKLYETERLSNKHYCKRNS